MWLLIDSTLPSSQNNCVHENCLAAKEETEDLEGSSGGEEFLEELVESADPVPDIMTLERRGDQPKISIPSQGLGKSGLSPFLIFDEDTMCRSPSHYLWVLAEGSTRISL